MHHVILLSIWGKPFWVKWFAILLTNNPIVIRYFFMSKCKVESLVTIAFVRLGTAGVTLAPVCAAANLALRTPAAARAARTSCPSSQIYICIKLQYGKFNII
jgi:hypothetical protein